MPPPLPVAGYFRVSQARDGMHAPELYLQEINRYCAYRQLEIGEIFSDVDFSARKGARQRPSLERLRLARRQFSAVIIPKLSRFGRSMKDLIELFDEFDSDAIPLVFLDMNIDTSTSQGRLLRHVMSAFAEYESDVKSDYAKANRQLAYRAGRQWTGNVPFGYVKGSVHTESYLPHPQRAAVVLELFERYLAGASATSLVRELNARGQTTTNGHIWRTRALMMMLERASYAALIRTNGELLPGNWQPIVPRETWDGVQARITAAKRPGQPPPRFQVHLLTRLLVCGVCGRRLYHRPSYRKSKGKYIRTEGIYHCSDRTDVKRCPGGAVSSRRAEKQVVDAFLSRDPFIVARSKQFPFEGVMNMREQWEPLVLSDKRKLLSLAIERIVLLPHSEETGRKAPRTIIIQWVDDPGDDPPPLTMRLEGSIGPVPRQPMPRSSATEKRERSRADWRELNRRGRFPDLRKKA